MPFTVAIIILGLEAASDLLMPTIMAQLIDQGVVAKNMEVIQEKGLLLLLLTGFGAASAALRNVISSHVSQKTGSEIRFDLYEKIQSLDFEQLNQFDSGSLITRLTNDVNLVQQFIHGIMRVFVKAPMIFLGSLIMVITLSGSLAMVLAIILPLVVLSIIMNMRIGYPHFMKMQEALDKLNGAFREYLAGVRVIKAFNRFEHEDDRFHSHNNRLSQAATKAMRIMAVFSPLNTLILNLGIALLLLLGGLMVNAGSFEVGKVMALVNYMFQIIMSLGLITMIFNLLIRTKASAERLNQIFVLDGGMEAESINNLAQGSHEEETRHHEAVKDLFEQGTLKFEKVSFKYDKSSDDFVLKDINFECRPNETIGIIGATGSGKSALLQLIPRFFNPQEGKILIGEVDYKTISPKALRTCIAVVPQKSFLFSGTIEDNLKWGNPAATSEDLQSCLKMACADGFVESFEKGLQTFLGQGGVNLSGGQKQRLSIARALVKAPNLILLDDATSAVDVTTERAIREGFKTFKNPFRCIIVAQRITSVKSADRILVLDQGRQVGFDTHDGLMKNCPVYKDIYDSQLGHEEVSE